MIRKITLTLESPFMLGGSEAVDAGLDAKTMMTADDRAMMAGTALKGLIKDAAVRLKEAGYSGPNITALFGEKSAKGSKNEPRRGRLHFSDLIATDVFDRTVTTRIGINPETGSAKEGALLVAELAAPPRTHVELNGLMHYTGVLDENWIKDALACIEYVGQWRHIGFGKLVKADLLDPDPIPLAEYTPPRAEESSYLLVAFDGPFVVSSQRPDGNSYAGDIIIPGGALKGAIADLCVETIGEELSALTFDHGFPVLADAAGDPCGGRTAALPASAVILRDGTKQYARNAMRLPLGPLALSSNAEAMSAAFAIDWKPEDSAWVDERLTRKPIYPERQQRTRASIDGNTGTAKDGNLFSQEAVCPWLEGDSSKRVYWAFRIGGSESDRAKLAQAIGDKYFLLGKLKTGMRAVAWRNGATVVPEVSETDGHITAVITLETPALMTPISDIEQNKGDVRACYQNFFKHLANYINLEDFYATQRQIVGYQAIRYQVSDRRFEPWVLTEAGSTFRVSAPKEKENEFKALLAEWQQSGLPPAQAVPAGTKAWQASPFPRENGYGAVTVTESKASGTDLTYPQSAWWRL